MNQPFGNYSPVCRWLTSLGIEWKIRACFLPASKKKKNNQRAKRNISTEMTYKNEQAQNEFVQVVATTWMQPLDFVCSDFRVWVLYELDCVHCISYIVYMKLPSACKKLELSVSTVEFRCWQILKSVEEKCLHMKHWSDVDLRIY